MGYIESGYDYENWNANERSSAIRKSENMRAALEELLRRRANILDAPWEGSRSGLVETDSVPRIRGRYNRENVLIFASHKNLDEARWFVFEFQYSPNFFMVPPVGRAEVMPYKPSSDEKLVFPILNEKRDASMGEINKASSVLEHIMRKNDIRSFHVKKPSTYAPPVNFYEALPPKKSDPRPAPLHSEVIGDALASSLRENIIF